MQPAPGYSEQIGLMATMLESSKDQITEDVKGLDQEQTDYLFDAQANSIGALLMHLIATESYYQVESLEGRNWTEEEVALWEMASGLGEATREAFKGKPIQYYLDLWDQVREKTLAGLKAKDDAWFAAEVDDGINNHWVWYHVLDHQANHRGQIALIKKRLPE